MVCAQTTCFLDVNPSSELQAAIEPHKHHRHDTRSLTMSKPTANWEKVGDKFYRKVQLYTAVFDQDLELENYKVVGAPYSGAVGKLHSPAQVQASA